LKHNFDDGKKTPFIIDPKSVSCNTCGRIQNISKEKFWESGALSEDQATIVLIVDQNYEKYIGECGGKFKLELVNMTETDVYEDYYKIYSKKSSQESKAYHLIFWYPSDSQGFNLKATPSENITFGREVAFLLSTKSANEYNVVWTATSKTSGGKNNEDLTVIETGISDEKSAEARKKIVRETEVCATVEACQLKKCITVTPSEICNSVKHEVKLLLDYDGKFAQDITKFGLKATHEIRQPREGARIFNFLIERQCGVEQYQLKFREIGTSTWKSAPLNWASTSTLNISDKNVSVLNIAYSVLYDEHLVDDEIVVEIDIVPLSVSEGLSENKDNSKTYFVTFQKCN